MKTGSSREAVRHFVRSSLVKRQEDRNVGDGDNLIVKGILDSLGIMKLVNFVEEGFRLTVKDEDVVPENFESIEAIASYVDRSLSRGDGEGEPENERR